MAMNVAIKNNKLYIEIDLEKPTSSLSSSGKMLVVARSRANVVTAVEIDGKPVTIGLNAYINRDRFK